MPQSAQPSIKNKGLVVLKTHSNRVCPVQWREAFTELAKPQGGAKAALRALKIFENARRMAPDGSLEEKLSRISPDNLDQALLAALLLEGSELGLRKTLRQEPFFPQKLVEPLPSATLVDWLSGGDKGLAAKFTKRLHPQSPLLTGGFLISHHSNVPLEGVAELSPALAGLLVSDGTSSRMLEWGMKLSWPVETLQRVVLSVDERKKVDEALAYARKEGRLNFLLCGEPGTGKTILACALAHEMGKSLLTLESVGGLEDTQLLLRAFVASRVENAVLFLDEFERWAGRGDQEDYRLPSSSGILLTHVEKFGGVLVGATNHALPKPFYRRFPFVLWFHRPERVEARKLWSLHLGKGVDQEVLDQVSTEFLMTGGLIANAVATAKADSNGAMPGLKALQEAASAQFQDELGWRSNWRVYGEGMDPWDWLEQDSQQQIEALARRLKEVRSWLKPVLSTSRLDGICNHKVLLAGPNEAVLSAACRRIGEITGLKPVYRYIRSLQSSIKDKPSFSLESALYRACRAGMLPLLIVNKVEMNGELEKILSEFRCFTGIGLVVCEEENLKDIPFKPMETLRLKEIPSSRWATILKEYLVETDSYRFEGIDPETLLEKCGKQNPVEILSLAVLEARANLDKEGKAVVNWNHVTWAVKAASGGQRGILGHLFEKERD